MEEENTPQTEDAEEVEAHQFSETGPEEPGKTSARSADEEDEVEAHHFRGTGPEEPGKTSA